MRRPGSLVLTIVAVTTFVGGLVLGGSLDAWSAMTPQVPPPPRPAGADQASLVGTSWRLESASVGVPVPPDTTRITLRFDAERISVSSGCNRGTGAYSIENGVLVASTLAMTRMACAGPFAQWEPAFLEVLASKPSIARDGPDLVLKSADRELRFRSVPVPSASAQKKFIYVAAERKPCSGVAPMACLQVREDKTAPWRLYHGEIVGFTHVPGTEYRLRILEDRVANAPADASSVRWFLDLVVEQRLVGR